MPAITSTTTPPTIRVTTKPTKNQNIAENIALSFYELHFKSRHRILLKHDEILVQEEVCHQMRHLHRPAIFLASKQSNIHNRKTHYHQVVLYYQELPPHRLESYKMHFHL